jgi:Skp family chaperone for outer membrane proteins
MSRRRFALLLLLLAVAPALNPTPGRAQTIEAAIVVVDFGRVLRDSKAAQSIAAQIGQVRAAAQDEFGAIEDDLVKTQSDLTNERATLPPDQFETKWRDFERRLTDAQRAAEARRSAIDSAEQDALGRVRAALIAAINDIATERGARIVLDRNDVVVVAPEFDISSDALQRLDAALPDVTVTVAETPPPP